MNIEVIDITESDEPKKTGKGTNKVYTVTYKSDEGKVEAKKLYGWATKKEVWDLIGSATKGQVLNVEKEKNDKGYWEWLNAYRQDAPMKTNEARPVPTKPTYETPEERAQKQVMIVRQSSINAAVNLLTHKDAKFAKDVLEVSKLFETHVMGATIHNLENDIPE
jgi:hypothetical protein